MPASASADGARLNHARPLPQGRAIVGGLLVVAAVALVVIATRSGDDEAEHHYVTAAVDLDIGHLIEIDDLVTTPLDLGEQVRSHAFDDPGVLVGAVVISPVPTGSLVQSSVVTLATASERPGVAAVEISFPVDRERAPRSLQRGERVTVLATTGSLGVEETTVAVADATVVSFDVGDDGFATSRSATLTLALSTTHDEVAVVHLTQVADLAVVRSNQPVGLEVSGE